MTPVIADGKGFPDLVISRGVEAWYIELKTDTGNVTSDQVKWLDALLNTTDLVTVLRPAAWHIERERFE